MVHHAVNEDCRHPTPRPVWPQTHPNSSTALAETMQLFDAIRKYPCSIPQSISTCSGIPDRNRGDNAVARVILCDSKYACDAYSQFWGHIKDQLADYTVFVLLIASHIPSEAEQEKWSEMGIYDFLMEPVSKSALSRKIRAYEGDFHLATELAKVRAVSQLKEETISILSASIVNQTMQNANQSMNHRLGNITTKLHSLLINESSPSMEYRSTLFSVLADIGSLDICNVEKRNNIHLKRVSTVGHSLIMASSRQSTNTSRLPQWKSFEACAKQGYGMVNTSRLPQWKSFEACAKQGYGMVKEGGFRFRKMVDIPTISDKVCSSLTQWSFDLFNFHVDELGAMILEMFHYFDLTSVFGVNATELIRFTNQVRNTYLDNPYHNFQHAFDVTQNVFVFLSSMKASSYLCQLEILALLLAAICHDVGHDGFNNSYHVSTMSDLALRYNDTSVLENHHARTAYSLIFDSGFDIFGNCFTQDQRTVLRHLILTTIMSTDMGKHFEFCNQLNAKIECNALDKDSEEDRVLVMKLCIKAADLGMLMGDCIFGLCEGKKGFPHFVIQVQLVSSSVVFTLFHISFTHLPFILTLFLSLFVTFITANVTKKWNIASEWNNRITEEFFRQGDKEREIGLQPAPFMDRSQTNKFKNAISFTKFVARPLFKSLVVLLHASKECYDNLEVNLNQLENEAKEFKSVD